MKKSHLRLYNPVWHLTITYCLFCVIGITQVQVAIAQQNQLPPLLAVTDLRTLGDNSSTAESQAFSEFIRRQIENTGKYRLISRSSMLSILRTNNFSSICHELPCFTRMGRLIGADQILAGHVQRQGQMLEITLRLINVPQSRIINTVYRTGDNLTSDDLLGDWGMQIIQDVFRLTDADFENNLDDVILTDQDKLASVPNEIKNKYQGFQYIPAGEVNMGSNNGDRDEYPVHKVFVEAFYIAKHELTNQEYKEFIDATGHTSPSNWSGNQFPAGKQLHPVSFVSQEDAIKYCQWRGVRLPTETEWERAAKGSLSYDYPWGHEFSSELANTWETGVADTVSVGSYPKNASIFGVLDLAGNVFEWVSGQYKPYPGLRSKPNEFDLSLSVLRGGSWNFNEYYARTSHRFARPGGEVARSYGFRVVRDAN